MKVNEFIEEFKNAGLGDELENINKHIVTDYISYGRKVAICENIINSCHYIDVDGVRVFKLNRPAGDMMLDIALVLNYTDIEINMDNAMDDYDALVSSGAFEYLKGIMPFSDRLMMASIYNDMLEDVVENEKNIVSLLNNVMSALPNILSSYVGGDK